MVGRRTASRRARRARAFSSLVPKARSSGSCWTGLIDLPLRSDPDLSRMSDALEARSSSPPSLRLTWTTCARGARLRASRARRRHLGRRGCRGRHVRGRVRRLE